MAGPRDDRRQRSRRPRSRPPRRHRMVRQERQPVAAGPGKLVRARRRSSPLPRCKPRSTACPTGAARAAAASTAVRPAPSSPPGSSTRTGACPGSSRSTAICRGPTGRRSRIASTDATTARTSARRTSAPRSASLRLPPSRMPWRGSPVLDLLVRSDDEILARHGEWYIPRRDPDQVRRNALVVLGNTADPADRRVAATLERYLAHPNPVLRRHAAWACRRLGRPELAESRRHDPAVAEELAEAAPARRP